MAAAPSDCEFARLVQQESWNREFVSKQKRREAQVLRGWSFSAYFRALCHRFELRAVEDAERPDFILTGVGRIAVEVTRIVSPKKAIYDDSGHHPEGPYTSALRRSRPTREFHRQIETGNPPDTSLVRPHFESSADLDSDYYSLATERLTEKAKSMNQYARSYDHTVILLSDEMSEFEAVIERRLPELRVIRSSIDFPRNCEVAVVSCESPWNSLIYEV